MSFETNKATEFDESRFRVERTEAGIGFKTTYDAQLGGELGAARRIKTEVEGQMDLIKQATLQGPTSDMQSFYNLEVDLRAVPEHVYELVGNSLDNIAQHKIVDGQVEVALSLEETTLHARVSDNGTGVPESEAEDLFHKPIPSIKPGTDVVFGGAGTALFEMNNWAERNGGGITYERSDEKSSFEVSVDTHAHAYPIEEIGVSNSVYEARVRIFNYYNGRSQEILGSLSAQSDLSYPETEILYGLSSNQVYYGKEYNPNGIVFARRALDSYDAFVKKRDNK